jgi:hypothetical protein
MKVVLVLGLEQVQQVLGLEQVLVQVVRLVLVQVLVQEQLVKVLGQA